MFRKDVVCTSISGFLSSFLGRFLYEVSNKRSIGWFIELPSVIGYKNKKSGSHSSYLLDYFDVMHFK